MGVASGNVGLAFGLVVAAGLSTTIGSALVFFINQANVKYLAAALGASAGVMLYVSFAEIFTAKAVDGFKEGGYKDGEAYAYATITFFAGILFTYLLDTVVHYIGSLGNGTSSVRSPNNTPEQRATGLVGTFGTCFGMLPRRAEEEVPNPAEESTQATGVPVTKTTADVEGAAAPDCCAESKLHNCTINVQSPEDLKKMGVMTGLAIGLHNFPEGLATFVATLADEKLGVAIALAIAMHNIPEGVCVAFPVFYATGSRWKGFLWSLLSGVSEPIGGLFGYLVLYGNRMSSLAYGVLFAIVGGMMVYISLKELIPMALKYDPMDRVTMHSCFIGMAVMSLSLVLFR